MATMSRTSRDEPRHQASRVTYGGAASKSAANWPKGRRGPPRPSQSRAAWYCCILRRPSRPRPAAAIAEAAAFCFGRLRRLTRVARRVLAVGHKLDRARIGRLCVTAARRHCCVTAAPRRAVTAGRLCVTARRIEAQQQHRVADAHQRRPVALSRVALAAALPVHDLDGGPGGGGMAYAEAAALQQVLHPARRRSSFNVARALCSGVPAAHRGCDD
eukprot:scaffold25569_cov61-Phaeocystis_antarctica.AAC.1